jgi:hypothetical protein
VEPAAAADFTLAGAEFPAVIGFSSHGMQPTLGALLTFVLFVHVLFTGEHTLNLPLLVMASSLSLTGCPLIAVMPCSFCCAAKGIMTQDTAVLVPMMPMGDSAEDGYVPPMVGLEAELPASEAANAD